MSEVIICKTVRDLPGEYWPVTYSYPLDKLTAMYRQAYGREPAIYSLSGLLAVAHAEAR